MIEQKRPWFYDVASHPKSDLISFYGSGRCQNPEYAICPYCGEKNRMSPVDTDFEKLEFQCGGCDRTVLYEASFGRGFSTYPMPCENGVHHYVYCSQYEYQGKYVRIHRCIKCEDQLYEESEYPFLPWLSEYDDPDYFDPEEIMKC